MTIKTTKWDAADYLDNPKAIAEYLNAAFEDGNPELIAAALGDVARAKGMSKIAKTAGITREALYKSLSKEGDPKLSTLLGVTEAIGFKLIVSPEKKTRRAA